MVFLFIYSFRKKGGYFCGRFSLKYFSREREVGDIGVFGGWEFSFIYYMV